LKVAPDFDHTKPESDTRISSCIARLADGDLYFVDNRNDRDETVDATFRVSGKAPGAVARRDRHVGAGILQNRGRPHHVPLHLEPWGGLCRVPQADLGNLAHAARRRVETLLATVDGPWTVSFQPGRGAPAHHAGQAVVVERQPGCGREVLLRDRHLHEDIDAPADWFKKGAACGSIWAT
jgi:hypothetical protein